MTKRKLSNLALTTYFCDILVFLRIKPFRSCRALKYACDCLHRGSKGWFSQWTIVHVNLLIMSCSPVSIFLKSTLTKYMDVVCLGNFTVLNQRDILRILAVGPEIFLSFVKSMDLHLGTLPRVIKARNTRLLWLLLVLINSAPRRFVNQKKMPQYTVRRLGTPSQLLQMHTKF